MGANLLESFRNLDDYSSPPRDADWRGLVWLFECFKAPQKTLCTVNLEMTILKLCISKYGWSVDQQHPGTCCVNVNVTQLCRILCDPMGHSPPDSSVCGISQAKILEWVAIPFSRGTSQARDQTWVSCIAGRFFTTKATWEYHLYLIDYISSWRIFLDDCIRNWSW